MADTKHSDCLTDTAALTQSWQMFPRAVGRQEPAYQVQKSLTAGFASMSPREAEPGTWGARGPCLNHTVRERTGIVAKAGAPVYPVPYPRCAQQAGYCGAAGAGGTVPVHDGCALCQASRLEACDELGSTPPLNPLACAILRYNMQYIA